MAARGGGVCPSPREGAVTAPRRCSLPQTACYRRRGLPRGRPPPPLGPCRSAGRAWGCEGGVRPEGRAGGGTLRAELGGFSSSRRARCFCARDPRSWPLVGASLRGCRGGGGCLGRGKEVLCGAAESPSPSPSPSSPLLTLGLPSPPSLRGAAALALQEDALLEHLSPRSSGQRSHADWPCLSLCAPALPGVPALLLSKCGFSFQLPIDYHSAATAVHFSTHKNPHLPP